jgi:hypothetical protein
VRRSAVLLLVGSSCSSIATVGQLTPIDAAAPDAPAIDARADTAPFDASVPRDDEDDAATVVDARAEPSAEASVECVDHDDCMNGLLCARGACVQCVSDEHCARAEESTCDARGRCVECRSSAQCIGERLCAPWGECELACTRDTQCASGLRCDPTAGVCLECASDMECPGVGEFCDEGVCRPCAFDSDCRP